VLVCPLLHLIIPLCSLTSI